MSIESVQARIAEIEARIRALTQEPPAQQPVLQDKSYVDGADIPSIPSAKPFNVALAEATGGVSIKPDNPPLSPDIEALVSKYSAKYGLNPNLVRAVIRVESDGNTKSVSSQGAMGLMQLMPDELNEYGVRNPFDPEANIAAGVKQLSDKLKLFNGNLPLALAAYNAGSGAVEKYHGVPPYPETQRYVQKILQMISNP